MEPKTTSFFILETGHSSFRPTRGIRSVLAFGEALGSPGTGPEPLSAGGAWYLDAGQLHGEGAQQQGGKEGAQLEVPCRDITCLIVIQCS